MVYIGSRQDEDDANDAGGVQSHKCTLILTEGDSAKALAMAGLSVVGRNYYGVFPLRGKLPNVREASHKQIMENAKIQNIKKILGLQHGKQYDSVKSLRYDHLMMMTDQVLPEIGHQLLHNYAEQIQNWGWICNINTQSSKCFKKNLKLLQRQPSAATLLAVRPFDKVALWDSFWLGVFTKHFLMSTGQVKKRILSAPTMMLKMKLTSKLRRKRRLL